MPSRIVVSKTNWIRIPLRGYFSRNFLVGVSDNLCMTLPRQVVPGRDYMITRRCSERRNFLRPDDDTNNAFIYCLALACQTREGPDCLFRLDIETPPHRHPRPRWQFSHLRRALSWPSRQLPQNAHLGRFERLWSSEATSVVRLVEPEDIRPSPPSESVPRDQTRSGTATPLSSDCSPARRSISRRC